MAMKALNRLSQDEIIQIQYLNREIAQMDYNTGMYEAEKRGLEQGIQKGLLEAARNMLRKNYPLAEITEMTGLSASELNAL